MSNFSENLRRVRLRRGWTQARIAKLIRIDRSNYCKYETSTIEPSYDTLLELCRYLETSPNELLGWNDNQ